MFKVYYMSPWSLKLFFIGHPEEPGVPIWNISSVPLHLLFCHTFRSRLKCPQGISAQTTMSDWTFQPWGQSVSLVFRKVLLIVKMGYNKKWYSQATKYIREVYFDLYIKSNRKWKLTTLQLWNTVYMIWVCKTILFVWNSVWVGRN